MFSISKIKLLISYSIIVLLIGISYFLWPIQKSKADTTYPVPHRSWIKLAMVAYQSTMTPEQIDWAAKNIDWFDNPYTNFLLQYKAKTDAPMLVYDNYYCLYVGQAKYNSLVNYVNSHGLILENMFMHFDVETTITLENATYTLPAGSRVPSYGWYGTGGDLTKTGARVIMNANNSDFRQFNAEYELSLVNSIYNNASYDGIFVDNSAPGFLQNNAGTIVQGGGTYAEYPGKTRAEAKALYDADIVLTFEAVRNIFGPKSVPGSKFQVPNSSYDNWTAIFPYIDGVFREWMVQPSTNNVDGVDSYIQKIAATNDAGIPSVISAIGMGNTNTDLPREKMTGLSLYYLAASSNDYFCRQDKNGGDPQTYNWYGAIDYDIGLPKAASYTFARGADPSSTKIDSGTGIITHPSGYVLTDTSKNWITNEWQNKKLVDSSNNVFTVGSNTTNSITMWANSPPYPVSGPYQIGNYIYKIYAREYDNALILVRPKSTWDSNEKGDPSAVTKDLPQTADNPSGRYFLLNADGTVDTNALTQITLRNAEGVVLIKESALSRPSISKSVDKLSASSGDILTYTINYSNPTADMLTNVRIEDPIPNGTTFVFVNNSGVWDGNKIIWNLGDINSGAVGTLSFQVRVQ